MVQTFDEKEDVTADIDLKDSKSMVQTFDEKEDVTADIDLKESKRIFTNRDKSPDYVPLNKQLSSSVKLWEKHFMPLEVQNFFPGSQTDNVAIKDSVAVQESDSITIGKVSDDKTTDEESGNKTTDEASNDKTTKEKFDDKMIHEESYDKTTNEESDEKPTNEESHDRRIDEESDEKPTNEESHDRRKDEEYDDKTMKNMMTDEESDDKTTKEESDDKTTDEECNDKTTDNESVYKTFDTLHLKMKSLERRYLDSVPKYTEWKQKVKVYENNVESLCTQKSCNVMMSSLEAQKGVYEAKSLDNVKKYVSTTGSLPVTHTSAVHFEEVTESSDFKESKEHLNKPADEKIDMLPDDKKTNRKRGRQRTNQAYRTSLFWNLFCFLLNCGTSNVEHVMGATDQVSIAVQNPLVFGEDGYISCQYLEMPDVNETADRKWIWDSIPPILAWENITSDKKYMTEILNNENGTIYKLLIRDFCLSDLSHIYRCCFKFHCQYINLEIDKIAFEKHPTMDNFNSSVNLHEDNFTTIIKLNGVYPEPVCNFTYGSYLQVNNDTEKVNGVFNIHWIIASVFNSTSPFIYMNCRIGTHRFNKTIPIKKAQETNPSVKIVIPLTIFAVVTGVMIIVVVFIYFYYVKPMQRKNYDGQNSKQDKEEMKNLPVEQNTNSEDYC